jgi:hypothetical protein
MLVAERPNFKKAVFLVENADFDNSLSYQSFSQEITNLANLCRMFHQANPLIHYAHNDRATVETWGAIFTVMTDSVAVALPNGKKAYHVPFAYDFEDYFGEKDWTKMFVTKLLATGKGNCHSLPYLYKILCKELGVTANLALAPNHMYVKHRSEKTGWYNTELTSATFPIDAWLMATGYIHLSAIQNGIYLKALTEEESIALCLLDLAEGYRRRTNGSDPSFVLKCCDTALLYFPLCVNALLLKAEVLKAMFEKTSNQNLLDEAQALYLQAHDLGYRQMPKTMYLDWLLELQNTKEKYLHKGLPGPTKK